MIFMCYFFCSIDKYFLILDGKNVKNGFRTKKIAITVAELTIDNVRQKKKQYGVFFKYC